MNNLCLLSVCDYRTGKLYADRKHRLNFFIFICECDINSHNVLDCLIRSCSCFSCCIKDLPVINRSYIDLCTLRESSFISFNIYTDSSCVSVKTLCRHLRLFFFYYFFLFIFENSCKSSIFFKAGGLKCSILGYFILVLINPHNKLISIISFSC